MFTFEQLIDPIGVEVFFREYLDRKPLHLSRRPSTHYEALFSWAEMEDIACRGARGLALRNFSAFRLRQVPNQLGRGVEWLEIPEPGAFDRSDWLRSAWRRGYTAKFKRMDTYSTALARLVQEMRSLFNCAVTANAYVTPAGAQGLNAHRNLHDTLVVQVSGERAWRLGGAGPGLPPLRKTAPPAAEAASSQFVLRPGDLLYIPPGLVREPASAEGPSLHLTLAIYSYNWTDLIVDLCTQAPDRSPALSARVPAGPYGACVNAAELEGDLALALKELQRKELIDKANEAQKSRVLEGSATHGVLFPRAAPGKRAANNRAPA
jgi:ribosomal protein L16 Arg81 hydroxylase